jgi:transposase
VARFIAGVVAEMDLSELLGEHARKDGRGAAGYHPEMMARILLYGYVVGVRVHET